MKQIFVACAVMALSLSPAFSQVLKGNVSVDDHVLPLQGGAVDKVDIRHPSFAYNTTFENKLMVDVVWREDVTAEVGDRLINQKFFDGLHEVADDISSAWKSAGTKHLGSIRLKIKLSTAGVKVENVEGQTTLKPEALRIVQSLSHARVLRSLGGFDEIPLSIELTKLR